MKTHAFYVFLFPLLLMISANYLDKILGCDLQRIMTQSIWMRHIIAFLTLLFFLVIVDSNDGLSHDTFIQKIGIAISAYIFFILFCKTEGHITTILLLFIMISYFIKTYVRTLEQERNSLHKKINSINNSRIRLDYLQQTLLHRLDYLHQTQLPRVQIIENCLHAVILVLLLIGVVAYIGKQSKKRHRWLWSNFFFGCEKGCNFRRRYTFNSFSFMKLSKELKLGVSKIVHG